jgi:flagellar protein FliO/FliZ
MDLIWGLFGQDITLLNAALALGVVLVLIVLCVWALKFVFRASGNAGRGRNRRLSVVDHLSLDPRRQVLIIRRDNVEHVILTGGPQDIVLESNIPVDVAPVRQMVRRPPAPNPGTNPQGNTAAKPRSERVQDPVRPAPAMETLRELARPEPARRGGSLRHTGLMRPVNRPETTNPASFTENSDYDLSDSDRLLDDESSEEFRDFDRSEPPGGTGRYSPQR